MYDFFFSNIRDCNFHRRASKSADRKLFTKRPISLYFLSFLYTNCHDDLLSVKVFKVRFHGTIKNGLLREYPVVLITTFDCLQLALLIDCC